MPRAKTLDDIEQGLDNHQNALARRQGDDGATDPGLLLHWGQAIETAELLLHSCRSVANELGAHRDLTERLAAQLQEATAARDRWERDCESRKAENERLSARVARYHETVATFLHARDVSSKGSTTPAGEAAQWAVIGVCPECHGMEECDPSCILDVAMPKAYDRIQRAREAAGQFDRSPEEES